MAEQPVILVDQDDKITGQSSKLKAHQGKGLLHRAISVYLFNPRKELLIQQRSKHKLLWPLVWANTCCSHPFPGETYLHAANRRLSEEMGLTVDLKLSHKFVYQAEYKQVGSEHEMYQMLIGVSPQKPHPNPREVADWKYVSLAQLNKEIKSSPGKFTPWLKLALKKLSLSDIFNS